MKSFPQLTQHPWHGVSPGDALPQLVRAIIEISSGSKAKYEVDKDSGLLRLDRVLFSAVHYPANYGFIPQTLGDDGDPLDILVFSQVEFTPGCIVEAKIVGVMRMVDQSEIDDKIIAVAARDMSVAHINAIEEMPVHLMLELKNFFEDYKKLEKKEVKVESFLGTKEAFEILTDSITRYNEEFGDPALR
jgi:inorganic pyrophosphatase